MSDFKFNIWRWFYPSFPQKTNTQTNKQRNKQTQCRVIVAKAGEINQQLFFVATINILPPEQRCEKKETTSTNQWLTFYFFAVTKSTKSSNENYGHLDQYWSMQHYMCTTECLANRHTDPCEIPLRLSHFFFLRRFLVNGHSFATSPLRINETLNWLTWLHILL